MLRQAGTKLVSVIIPVYNGADYLREAIDSVLSQTFDDYELIVVDDGSTDDTPAIAKSYGARLTYIRQENKGVAAALNRGILRARGKYIAWLSHDDVFLPNKLERQVDFMRQFPEFKACYTDSYAIDSHGTIIQEREEPWYPRQQAVRILFSRMYIRGCSMLIERACFDKVGLFNEKLRYTQDAEMWFRMLRHFEVGRVPGKLTKYRTHPDQGSRRNVEAHTAEKQAMYKQVFEDLGVAGVFPELAESANDPRAMAWAYQWLGDTTALHQGLYSFADEQYRQSVALWPSWRNPARLKLAVGIRRILWPRRLYYGIRRVLGAGLRAVGLNR